MPAFNGAATKPKKTVCDVHNGSMQKDGTLEPGCGRDATFVTDGTEEDTATTRVPMNPPDPEDPLRGRLSKLNRKALPNIYVCDKHTNWPFSDDAKTFARTKPYIDRAESPAPAKK